jgi:FdhD protein
MRRAVEAEPGMSDGRGNHSVPVLRWPPAGNGRGDDCIAHETPVALVYNGIAHVVMMATPLDLEDFALGFSLTEGILAKPTELYAVECTEQADGIELAMTISAERFAGVKERRRNLTGRTGCGLCGAESLQQALRPLQPLTGTAVFTHEAVQRAVLALQQHQPLQEHTGAVHAAAWCSAQGDILLVREDVGRHNALDKLIGAIARQSQPHAQDFLLISSRASYEMVAKAASAGFQLLAAISAPTTLAIQLAEQAGLTLVGFARPGRHSIYTHPQRLQAGSE